MTDGESEKNCFHFSKKAINLRNVDIRRYWYSINCFTTKKKNKIKKRMDKHFM